MALPDSDDVPKDLKFTFQHEGCWLQETTERHRDIVMIASGMYQAKTGVYTNLAVHGPKATIKQLQSEWSSDPRILKVELLQETSQGSFFHIGYQSSKSMFRHVLEHTPVSIGATRHAQGKEYHQVIGDPADLEALIKALSAIGTLKVTALRDFGATEVATKTKLSELEAEALIIARLGGYYEKPRKKSAQDLARETSTSHTAFLNHLRQAESKILNAYLDAMSNEEPGRIEATEKRLEARTKGGALQRRPR